MSKATFYLRFKTKPGQSLNLIVFEEGERLEIPLSYWNEEFWCGTYSIPKQTKSLNYHYSFKDPVGGPGGSLKVEDEWEKGRTIELSIQENEVIFIDTWNSPSSVENALLTQPFTKFLSLNYTKELGKNALEGNLIFRVKAPNLSQNQSIGILGNHSSLGNWETENFVPMLKNGDWYEASLKIEDQLVPLVYKYGVHDLKSKAFLGFEEGHNRSLPFLVDKSAITLVQDGFINLPNNTWKGAGVAVPVFSLRTENSWGVGEFTDIKGLADWSKEIGLKLIQLLPINDTAATGTWTDSYPYASISAFGLNPIYLNIPEVAGKSHLNLVKDLAAKGLELNKLSEVDYEKSLSLKWEAISILYPKLKEAWWKDSKFQKYLKDNEHWLNPYAVFCMLKEDNKTSDFSKWKKHSKYNVEDFKDWFKPASKNFDAVSIHIFVQWHLHLQLESSTDYAHKNGLVVKGDIPIGIYRYSCDAWVAPELYYMNWQAGAPPDDFAEKGQNWGFPTYNWDKMKQDGFSWWKQRFDQMSLYFDAFRIDHILGFFRIWSIPLDAVEGILGRFVPAIPIHGEELIQLGIGRDRLCQPYISNDILNELFGYDAKAIVEKFLVSHGHGFYSLKKEYDNQRKIEAIKDEILTKGLNHDSNSLREKLYSLISNVILFEDQNDPGRSFHFRFGMEKTSSYKSLSGQVQSKLRLLYLDYFFKRQDDFWQIEAMEKLPSLKRSTDMLICGEDLGMVPHCVPDVMHDLGLLSLEIQRMPKAQGAQFFHPKDAPYLSVVTPSTHDMSTIRGWWEEDKELTRRFFNSQLGLQGEPPFFCEPWINEIVINQHLYSPAMWCIFQWQDWMGMDQELRRENPNEERINLPSNPKHYWRYRMHISLEDMLKKKSFNEKISSMIKASGRG
jgi:4-alpha-glucanotransferase